MAPTEQRRLIDAGNQFLKFNNTCLRHGAQVQFKAKGGVIIQGIFIRMKTKNAEVQSNQGRGGIQMPYTVKWNVSPELLMPVQAKVV